MMKKYESGVVFCNMSPPPPPSHPKFWILVLKIQFIISICSVGFVNHGCFNGCKCCSFVAFVVVVVVMMMMMMSTHLLYKLVQDLLGDVSTLAPILSTFSAAHFSCMFSSCPKWNVLFVRVLFICKLYSGMELAHIEIFI